ncbi:MAG: thioredoxin domain-containing protein [Bacteroidia bacterium]|nr:thioredoxin domain-containing protein [Bacteroidia bacterium]
MSNSLSQKIPSSSQRTFIAIVLCIVIGLSLSVYLFTVHIGVRLGTASGGLCTLLGGGCDEALRSPFSKVLGVPLAAWGIVFYAILIVQLTMHGLSAEGKSSRANGVSVVLAAAAAIGGMTLLSLMSIGATAFCPLCAVVHGINLAIAVLLLKLTARPIPVLLRRALELVRSFVLSGSPLSTAQRLSVTGTILAVLCGLAFYLWAVIIEKDFDRRAESVDEQALVLEFNQLPIRPVAIEADDAVMGDTSALVKVVLFSDFGCPGCGLLARELMKLEPLFGRDAVLVFKHMPLDSDCNPMLETPLHPFSCEAARAADAARLQGRFWDYHDALFLSGVPDSDAGFIQLAVETGCDSLRFLRDFKSTEVASAIARDVTFAGKLRLAGTPSLFINGRQIRDLRPRAVHALLERIMLDVRRFKAAFAPVPADSLKEKK